MCTPIQNEGARFWLKPQLTRVGSVVVDLAGVDQHRVGVEKLMALKKIKASEMLVAPRISECFDLL